MMDKVDAFFFISGVLLTFALMFTRETIIVKVGGVCFCFIVSSIMLKIIKEGTFKNES